MPRMAWFYAIKELNIKNKLVPPSKFESPDTYAQWLLANSEDDGGFKHPDMKILNLWRFATGMWKIVQQKRVECQNHIDRN